MTFLKALMISSEIQKMGLGFKMKMKMILAEIMTSYHRSSRSRTRTSAKSLRLIVQTTWTLTSWVRTTSTRQNGQVCALVLSSRTISLWKAILTKKMIFSKQVRRKATVRLAIPGDQTQSEKLTRDRDELEVRIYILVWVISQAYVVPRPGTSIPP